MTVLIVVGTGPGVGTTTVVAALAELTPGSTAVVKIAQTGRRPGEPGDVDAAARLVGLAETLELARYPDALAPRAAARHSGLPQVVFADAVRRIDDLAGRVDTVLIDGNGGPATPFGDDGWTVLDLAGDLHSDVVLVVPPDPPDATQTTVAYLEAEYPDLAGLVIGNWPATPTAAMLANLEDLRRLGPKRALTGALPAGIAASPKEFRRRADAALGPELGGEFDSRAFLTRWTQHLP